MDWDPKQYDSAVEIPILTTLAKAGQHVHHVERFRFFMSVSRTMIKLMGAFNQMLYPKGLEATKIFEIDCPNCLRMNRERMTGPCWTCCTHCGHFLVPKTED